ncbi:MAG: NTP transferase domain-containing protein [Candidatus Pacebacteria bacterium]|nr:NTP transferase domain-containing protein [Candidatus Paceibacterota bacterium]
MSNLSSIKKAVISAAGFGTRFLPISKTIQKEMLPILNRPVIDYVVSDCVRAGIEEIIIIINQHNSQVLHYFRENKRLKNYLKDKDKAELYDQIEHLHQQSEFHFIRQPDDGRYGTAIPLQLAQEYLENEQAFLYLTGDDFIYQADKNFSFVREMIDHYQQTKAEALVTCYQRPDHELHRYGVAKIRTENRVHYLEDLVEKPQPGKAPSNLANISKYILTPEVLKIIENQQPNPDSGEYYITDTLVKLCQSKPVTVLKANGEYLDGGNVYNWLRANLILAGQNNRYQELVLNR